MLPSISILMAMSIMVNIDASVIIHQTGVDVGSDSYECGEQLVLSCQINGYLVSMSWQNDSSSVPFAQCVYDMCTLDSTVNNIFEFTRNTTIGLFNLIFNVTNYNNGVIYTCSDGSTIYSSRVLTKDYRPTFNETMERQLKAMSGCVNQSVRIEFKWKKVQGSSMEESEYNPTYVDNNQAIDTTVCLSDTECGAADAIQHIRTIEADPGGLSDYHLKVIVIYDGFSMESFATKETYKVKDCGLLVKDYIFIIFISICLVTDVILCFVYSWRIFRKENENRDCLYSVYADEDRKYFLWCVYAGKYASFIPLCASSILILVNHIPCDTAHACSSCEFWTYLGYSECACIVLHVIFAVIVIIIKRDLLFQGFETYVTDVNCVRFLFFFNVLELMILVALWICSKYKCESDCVFSSTLAKDNTVEELEVSKISECEHRIIYPAITNQSRGEMDAEDKEMITTAIEDPNKKVSRRSRKPKQKRDGRSEERMSNKIEDNSNTRPTEPNPRHIDVKPGQHSPQPPIEVK